MPNNYLTLPADMNQARGIARYAIDFVAGRLGSPAAGVAARTEQFHLDSMGCGVSALALKTNAPVVLRNEALEYRRPGPGATCLGSSAVVMPEKAVLANCAAVREWDANGTNFGFNPERGHIAGEFGHNDFYPVAIAGAQVANKDGATALRAMVCLDEIRGRLAEVYSLKDHHIDHVVHGAIASAAVYGALVGAAEDQIESALGILLAHYIPFRAIRAGHQLSDSKGASAAISAEAAIVSIRRAMRGFAGPADIFRNPQAIFRKFQPTPDNASPFDLILATEGDDFAVMGMHFKLGLYEHQSAGAIEGLMRLLAANPQIAADLDALQRVRITIYEPALSIIGDPAKRNPQTRQSADHSMVYIIATLIRKAHQTGQHGWRELMLLPEDYGELALADETTRALIGKIEFVHGGPDFDARYPDGIPTTLEVDHASLGRLSSGLVMYPVGHARGDAAQLDSLLKYKFDQLVSLAGQDPAALRPRFTGLAEKSAEAVQTLYDFGIAGLP